MSSGVLSPKMLDSRVETFDLGQDKLVNILVPPGSRGKKIKSRKNVNREVTLPSSFALARLIAHCPSLVEDRNVMELSCGLGLVSAAACKHARPNHVALTDLNAEVLRKAYMSCTQLQQSKSSVSRCTMDWNDRSTWPNQNYDVLLASDVLADKGNILPLVNVLQFYLSSKGQDDKVKRALIVDPETRNNRDGFYYAVCKAGLEADPVPFPGMEGLVLISITPRGF